MLSPLGEVGSTKGGAGCGMKGERRRAGGGILQTGSLRKERSACYIFPSLVLQQVQIKKRLHLHGGNSVSCLLGRRFPAWTGSLFFSFNVRLWAGRSKHDLRGMKKKTKQHTCIHGTLFNTCKYLNKWGETRFEGEMNEKPKSRGGDTPTWRNQWDGFIQWNEEPLRYYGWQKTAWKRRDTKSWMKHLNLFSRVSKQLIIEGQARQGGVVSQYRE